jgi:trypsin
MAPVMSLLAALAMPALLFAAALPQDFTTQIVGGTAAAAGEFPFIVSVQTTSGSHFCGGTLLDADTVITAGHCAEGQTASRIRIRVGSTVSIA